MIGQTEQKVKSNPRLATFAIGDPDDRLSIAHAMAEGYRIALDGDGTAEVLKADGTAYHVVNFECDCPDRQGRGGSYAGHCKHEIYVSQLRPCELCGGIMALGEFLTAFGKTVRRFECESCGNARDFDLVKGERRVKRYGKPLDEKEAHKVCQAAIYDARWKDADRYVWDALKVRPDIAPAMAERLYQAKMNRLADEVAGRYGLKAEAQAAD
ncbi:MAG: hypothetical protein A3F84_12820 [Candidatus Handelsmanbacteria bacterium RIFCSPLOWO2_12_FULL_64_10]|uniref:SWIM-type domain-containing protein n=1 Tax=Handelsmanbacteria sp. (strain RIFCSPLOWO2_12_FULL_64_10) TaxID=1817868 RepID=A0A1F6CF41_HANXR|nr:MAG: hypothetical protein A3F84_12820 [Candidatus Handelsmanbacteria bacterium RIFCSPLOWO2_12_FULL_64_10]